METSRKVFRPRVMNLKFVQFKPATGERAFQTPVTQIMKALRVPQGQTAAQVLMLVLQDVNGKELDFGAEIQTPELIAVGVKCTIDGAPADGTFVLGFSGMTVIFKGGTLIKIIEPKREDATLLAAKALARGFAELRNQVKSSGRNAFKSKIANLKS